MVIVQKKHEQKTQVLSFILQKSAAQHRTLMKPFSFDNDLILTRHKQYFTFTDQMPRNSPLMFEKNPAHIFQLHCNLPSQFTPHLQQCEFTSSELPHLLILNCQLCSFQEIRGKMVSDMDPHRCEFCGGYENVRIARC